MKKLLLLIILATSVWSSPQTLEKKVQQFKASKDSALLVIYRPETYPSENHPEISIRKSESVIIQKIPTMCYIVKTLPEGKYVISSKTYKHKPKQLSLDLVNGKVHYIRISHGTGWVDIWYDLVESNAEEFKNKLNHSLLGKMKRAN